MNAMAWLFSLDWFVAYNFDIVADFFECCFKVCNCAFFCIVGNRDLLRFEVGVDFLGAFHKSDVGFYFVFTSLAVHLRRGFYYEFFHICCLKCTAE